MKFTGYSTLYMIKYPVDPKKTSSPLTCIPVPGSLRQKRRKKNATLSPPVCLAIPALVSYTIGILAGTSIRNISQETVIKIRQNYIRFKLNIIRYMFIVPVVDKRMIFSLQLLVINLSLHFGNFPHYCTVNPHCFIAITKAPACG
jgi:hypothetical protein